MHWHISVFNQDSTWILFYARVDPHKEAQCLAAEARHHSLAYKILIRGPDGTSHAWLSAEVPAVSSDCKTPLDQQEFPITTMHDKTLPVDNSACSPASGSSPAGIG
jgi:hypothetical protein